MERKKLSNVSWVAKHDLCVGCGVCQDVCPKLAITIVPKKGLYRPVVNEDLCINDKGCQRCRVVCPGGGVAIKQLSDKYFSTEENILDNPYIGKYIAHYSGYSNDHDIRYYGASGGMTTQFLIYLLEHSYIQGAIVTRFSKDREFLVDTFIAKTKEDILSAKSSKYCPVTMAGMATRVKELEGKYAVVGLPCHLHGLRKLAEIDKKFAERIFAYVGLYCSCGRNFSLTQYVFNSRGYKIKDIDKFTYRQGAGMGAMHAEIRNKDSKEDINEGYQHYFLALRSFFNVRRCMSCVDHFAELGDICFGDLHIGKYLEDKVGISSIVTRTNAMDSILKKMFSENVISLASVSKQDLLESQKYVKTKKHLNPAYIRIDRLCGRQIPEYDFTFQSSPIYKAFKGYIVKLTQMYVGRHKHLHWIIKKMCKDMTDWR
jgi:coenzyme F420 hydrogenase subunit beta